MQSGGVAEGKIASDAAGMDVFALVFDEAVEIIEPSDALVEVVEGEFELADDLVVIGNVGDDGNGENGTGDFFGIGVVANFLSGVIDRLGGGGEVVSDLLEKRNRQTKASHEEHAAFGLGDDFGEFGRSDAVV